jgi:uncharacterized protein YjiS (DUF1127 family)
MSSYRNELGIGGGDRMASALPDAPARWTGAAVDHVGRAVQRLRRHLREAWARRQSERQLLRLSERELRDIGLTRNDVHRLFYL